MTSQNEPAPADSSRRGWYGNAAVIVISIILVCMFALPGFIAGLLFRFPATQQLLLDNRVEYFFVPAVLLGSKVRPIGEFYLWEYQVAAGQPFEWGP